MKIQSVNQMHSFGKIPVMTCEIKQKDINQKKRSTLWKMDPKNSQDETEIRYSKHAKSIYSDFSNDRTKIHPYHEYFLLKDNETNEVIAAAMTSHHYRTGNIKFPGYTTLVEELENNKKYLNPSEAVMAYIVSKAFDRFDDSVSTAFYNDEPSSLKSIMFSQTDNGDWIMPEKRYMDFIDRAQKRYRIDFIV